MQKWIATLWVVLAVVYAEDCLNGDCWSVICRDGESECPEGTTCCESPDSGRGCCPIAEATCCGDAAHCCPRGSTCDVQQAKCVSSSTNEETPMLAQRPARKVAPGGQTMGIAATTATPTSGKEMACNESAACRDGQTCCRKKAGGWSCCPLPKAVCCEDFQHCCPHLQKCNLEHHTCDDGFTQVPWLEKSAAFPGQTVMEGGATCDSNLSCPEGSSCCQNPSGGWSCCPPAVNNPSGPEPFEEMGGGSTSTSTTAVLVAEDGTNELIICPDKTICPNTTTCCYMADYRKWGCCPVPQAQCCIDGKHCCPQYYKCDERTGTCYKGEVTIPWFSKVPSVEDPRGAPDSEPCDPEYRCPVHFTCCRVSGGQWGCCPTYEGVCCGDMKHCCPADNTCGEDGTCTPNAALQWNNWHLFFSKPHKRAHILQTHP